MDRLKRFSFICKIEFILFVRGFFGFFFALVFPLLMLFLFGSIYGNGPIYPDGNIGWMDVSVPAYAVMVMGVTGLMSLPLTLAACYEKKIYKRYDATPVGKKTILLAQVTINIFATLLGICILVAAGKLFYQIQIKGNIVSIIGAILLGTATMFAMGFLFTAIGRDIKITNLLCYLFYFAMIFLSGATLPATLFPEGVKKVAKILPMTYEVELMQGVFLGGTLLDYLPEVLILGGLAVLFALTGAFLYRAKDWS